MNIWRGIPITDTSPPEAVDDTPKENVTYGIRETPDGTEVTVTVPKKTHKVDFENENEDSVTIVISPKGTS